MKLNRIIGWSGIGTTSTALDTAPSATSYCPIKIFIRYKFKVLMEFDKATILIEAYSIKIKSFILVHKTEKKV